MSDNESVLGRVQAKLEMQSINKFDHEAEQYIDDRYEVSNIVYNFVNDK